MANREHALFDAIFINFISKPSFKFLFPRRRAQPHNDVIVPLRVHFRGTLFTEFGTLPQRYNMQLFNLPGILRRISWVLPHRVLFSGATGETSVGLMTEGECILYTPEHDRK
jgi:hypothetical protein